MNNITDTNSDKVIIDHSHGAGGTVLIDQKHGVGVVHDGFGVIDKTYGFDPFSKEFYSGIDPLDQIPIAVASKKRFLEWLKAHTRAYPIRNHKGVVDSGKVVRMTQNGIDFVGADLVVGDPMCEQFPFRMHRCDNFTIDMPMLRSLTNTPRECLIGRFGSPSLPMKFMDSLVGGPKHATLLTVFTENDFANLETSLEAEIGSISINARSILSFDGLNVNVKQLVINTTDQQSFRGIHKVLKNNVESFAIGVDRNYQGGVLPFAMLVPEIDVLADVAGNPPEGFVRSMEIVAESRHDGLNIHDIQERLIDAGLERYARL